MNQKKNLNLIFFGTDLFAVKVLEELEANGVLPKLIVTTPDRPKGRKLLMTPPEVKLWADTHEVKSIQPEKLNDFNEEADIFLVASYGKIIPKSILDSNPHKFWNIHPSLLPKLRGSSPIETAILEEDGTGVTIMEMDEKMDHGPILAQEKYNGEWPSNALAARHELALLGTKLFLKAIEEKPEPKEQDHKEATYTKKIEKKDALIDLDDDAKTNYRKFLAYFVWPRAFFFVEHNNRKIRVVITEATLENGEFKILKVIPEGKKEMDFESFKRGLIS